MKNFNYLDAIEVSSQRIYDLVKKTDFLPMTDTSQRLKNTIFFKSEEQQFVHSFKIRGAYNKVLSLSTKERKQGIITASAGNHAQGVALSTSHIGIKAKIVMPRTTPSIKIQSVRKYGGEVILYGDSFDEALTYALKLAKNKHYSFVHPYDDPYVIAGQGTIAKEICEQAKNPLDYLFVSVGGGGLISGISVYIKKFMPKCQIIAVESDDSACLNEAIKNGNRVTLEDVGLFADGIAVKQIGTYTFDLCKKYVDQFITVSSDEICSAIDDIFSDMRIIAETGSATAFAGMKKFITSHSLKNKNLAVINSGANINFDRLRYIAEQNEIGEGKEIILAVKIPEKPGSFVRLCRLLKDYFVSEFNYRYSSSKEAWVFVGLKQNDQVIEREKVLSLIKGEGFTTKDLTEDQFAKVHIRYMIGGKVKLKNEHLFQFTFPEKPKALLNFLEALVGKCNISLFHYRNHGAAFGRILMGADIPKTQVKEFYQTLEKISYKYIECTDNDAYRFFLCQ